MGALLCSSRPHTCPHPWFQKLGGVSTNERQVYAWNVAWLDALGALPCPGQDLGMGALLCSSRPRTCPHVWFESRRDPNQ